MITDEYVSECCGAAYTVKDNKVCPGGECVGTYAVCSRCGLVCDTRPLELEPMEKEEMSTPWEQMSRLEQHLRSELYHPTERKARMLEAIPRHVRRKEYKEAGRCQDVLRQAEAEILQWQELLDLYLEEKKNRDAGLTPHPEPLT